MLKNRPIFTIIAAVTAMGLSLSLSIPLVSLSLERQNVGADIIGLMGAVPAFAFLFVSPFVPHLTRIFGSGTLLWLSLFLCCGSILCLALNDNLIFWFLLRLLIGVGMSILFLITETWINQVASDHNRGRTIGLYVTFMTAGLASGPILINIIGTEGSFPFVVSSMIVAMAGIIFLLAGNNYPLFTGESSFSVLRFIRLAPLICSAVLLVAFFDGTVLTLIPIYGVRHGMTEGTAVIMTTVLLAGNILLQVPIGWIADLVGDRKIILVCGLVSVGGALALPVLMDYPLLLWPVLLFWGGCVGGAYTLGIVLMGRYYSGAELITANATSGVLWGMGSLAGPSAGGYAMKYSDTYGMPFVFAAVSVCFVAIAIWRNLKNGN